MTNPPPGSPTGPPPGPAPGHPPPRPVPMAPPADPTLAEWWQRLVARIIDGFVVSLISSPVYLVYFIWIMRRIFEEMDKYSRIPVGQEPPPMPVFISPVELIGFSFGIAIVVGILQFFYDWLCHARWGMTLGKRILKIKLVRAGDRGKVGAGAAAKRALAYPLGGIVPMVGSIWALVDVLWIFNDQVHRQCLHDKFAETVVIKTDPPRPGPQYGPPGYPPPGYPPAGYPPPGHAPGGPTGPGSPQ